MAEVYLQRLMTPPPPTPHPLVCGAISSNLGTDRIAFFERDLLGNYHLQLPKSAQKMWRKTWCTTDQREKLTRGKIDKPLSNAGSNIP